MCSMHNSARFIIALSLISVLLIASPLFRTSGHLHTIILSTNPFSFEANQSRQILPSFSPRLTILHSPLPNYSLHNATPPPSGKSLCSLPTTLPPLRTPPANLPALLTSYIHTHAHNRAVIAADPTKITSPNGPPLLVWRCHARGQRRCSGVGDRMRGIRFVFLLAVATNRTFFIDWPSTLHPLEIALIPSNIDWTIPLSLRNILPSEKSPLVTATYTHLHWWDRVSPYRVPLRRNKSLNLAVDDIPTALNSLPPLVMVNSLLGQAFNQILLRNPYIPFEIQPNYRNSLVQFSFETTRMLTRLLFRPSAATTDLLSDRLKFSRASYVAIHLRTGVDVGEQSIGRFRNIHSEKPIRIAQLLIRCAQRVANGTRASGRFAIATDSSIHAKSFRKIGKKLGVETSVPFRPAFHIARKKAQHSKKESRRIRDGCLDFLDVFVDLCLLAGSEVLVATKSGFSDAAVFMGNARRVGLFDYGLQGGIACKTTMRERQ